MWNRASSAYRRYARFTSPHTPAPRAIAVFTLSTRTVAVTPFRRTNACP